MKLYNKAGDICTAEKEQLDIMVDAGWSREKPAPPEEVSDESDEKEVSEETDTSTVRPTVRKPAKKIAKRK